MIKYNKIFNITSILIESVITTTQRRCQMGDKVVSIGFGKRETPIPSENKGRKTEL